MSVDLVCSIDEVLPVGPKGSKPGQGGQDQGVALGKGELSHMTH